MPTILGLVPEASDYKETATTEGIQRTRSIHLYIQGDGNQRERDILATPGLPARGDPFAWDNVYDFTCRLKSYSVTEHNEASHVWKVKAEYSTTQPSPEDEENDKQPQDRTPTWNWTTETLERAATKDAISGDPIVNSRDEPLFIPITVPIPVLQIKRYKTTFDPSDLLDYISHVNASSFWGAPAKAALMAAMTANQVDKEGQRLWEVTYTIKFQLGDYAEKGWQVELLDQSTAYIDSAGDLITFTDSKGNPVTGNLDGSGGKATTPATVFLTFDLYKTTDFDALDLGPW